MEISHVTRWAALVVNGGMVQPFGKWSVSKSLSAKGLVNKMGHNHPVWGTSSCSVLSKPQCWFLWPHWLLPEHCLGSCVGNHRLWTARASQCPVRGTMCWVTFSSIFSTRLSDLLVSFKCLKRNLNCQLNHSNSIGIDREVKLGHLACHCQGTVVLQWVFSDDFANLFSICQGNGQFLNWKNSTSSAGKLLCWFPAPKCFVQHHSICNKNRKGFKRVKHVPDCDMPFT